MEADRFHRLEELFSEALERSLKDRASYLDEVCGDGELRRELERLLDAHAMAEDAGEEGLAAEVGDSGRLIGSYRLLRRIGEGEHSTVYLGVRADTEYSALAAIKVVKQGIDSRSILRRFHQERQILATLEHPNIAQLFDGGRTEDGRPYFVMEHVEGGRIDEHCRERALTVDERLRLFQTVCSAVHYAHQNLVVHRDLKPGNILITPTGEPKLLDFGIAKLLDPELAAEQTATVGRLLTPRYASPEQVLGQPATTATDVYSLGVVLYELLTGGPPYAVEGRTLIELEQEICSAQPVLPSEAVRSAGEDSRAESLIRASGGVDRLRRRLEGDLDTIVMTALRKEPERRYASVRELSEDIDRHLERLPVRAQPDTLRYRAGKFMRRNALLVAASAVVALSLVAGMVLTTWQARQARQARDLAEMQRQRAEEALEQAEQQQLLAEQVSGFLTELFQVSDPGEARGNTITAREILDRGAGSIESELADQPEIQAKLMDTMAAVYHGLGLYDQARPLYEEALDLRRRVHGDRHLEVGKSANNLAALAALQGRSEEAERYYREALEIMRASDSGEPEMVGTVLSNLGSVMREQGEYEEAERLHGEAAEVFDALDPANPYVVSNLNNLSIVLEDLGRFEKSIELRREVLELTRQAFGADHPYVAVCLSNMAGTLQAVGRSEEAERGHREALDLLRKTLGDEHPYIALTLNNLASVMRDRGRNAEAEPLYRESLAISRRTLDEEHPNIALTLHNLAYVLMVKGNLDEAERVSQQAAAMWRSLYDDRHPNYAKTATLMAEIVGRRQRPVEAERMYRHAIDVYREALPAGHIDVASPLVGLGAIQIERGRPEEGEKPLREALALYRAAYPQGGWQVANAEGALGACLVELGRYAEAEPLLLESYAVLAADPARETLAATAATRLVKFYVATGRDDRADRYRPAELG